jgi:hypothetical protein
MAMSPPQDEGLYPEPGTAARPFAGGCALASCCVSGHSSDGLADVRTLFANKSVRLPDDGVSHLLSIGSDGVLVAQPAEDGPAGYDLRPHGLRKILLTQAMAG